MSWKASTQLMDTIRHYANFPATGVSLRQMVQFGEKPSIGEFQSKERNYIALHLIPSLLSIVWVLLFCAL